MNGLGKERRGAAVVQSGPFAVGIEGIKGRITKGVEEVTMNMIGAALGDCVDLAACRTAKLSGVSGDCGLKLLDGVGREDIGSAV